MRTITDKYEKKECQKLAAIVMASGFSRRMGENKLLLDYLGKPLVQHVLEAVAAVTFERRVIVTCYEAIAKLAKNLGFEAVYNPQPQLGQSQSVILGTSAIMDEDIDGAMYFTGDMPFLSPEVIKALQTAFFLHPQAIIRPVYGTQKTAGNPVIFPAAFFAELCAVSGDAGGRQVIRAHLDCVREVAVADWRQGTDIDNWTDVKNCLK